MVSKVHFTSARVSEDANVTTPSDEKVNVSTDSNDRDLWETPPEVFETLNKEFNFTLDAAATAGNALCENYFTEDDDALKQDWGNHVVWCNPPYSKLREFTAKFKDAAANGATVVSLVPSRTDTVAFHANMMHGLIKFIKGRLKFLKNGVEQNTAPFPSLICVQGPNIKPRMMTITRDELGIKTKLKKETKNV